MKFIAIQREGCYIETGNDVLDFLKKCVKYHGCTQGKIFSVLVDSGKLELAELINYANTHYLICDDEITDIYSLGEKIF